MIENNEQKKLWIMDMACPNEKNIGEKHREKLTKYQQLAFEMREKRPGYRVETVPIVIGCLGGSGEKDHKGRIRNKMDR